MERRRGRPASTSGLLTALAVGLGGLVAALRAEAAPDRPAPLPPPLSRRLASRAPEASLAPGPLASRPAAGRASPASLGGASSPGGLALVMPTGRPPRPTEVLAPGPEDLALTTEKPGGMFKRFPEPDGTAAYVMVGNPRLKGQEHRRADGKRVEALSIKANLLVVWVNEDALPDLARLLSAQEEDRRAPGQPPALTALFEQAVLGIYAEGAVEVLYGSLAFRAASLYLEPRTYRGLLIEPRLDGRLQGVGSAAGGIPAFVSGRRARLVAKGLLVFDEAEVSTSRADDRIVLKVRQLSVEEYAQEETASLGPAPALLGFQSLSTQRYRARDITLWGERARLAWLPYASFGTAEGFPVTIKRLDAGSRSRFGIYALVGVGGGLGPEEQPWGEWIVDVGGYAKRGPAAGLELSYGKPGDVTWARLGSRGVFPDTGTDRTGFDPQDEVRGRIVAEGRTHLRHDLLVDGELGLLSDRGYNREFLERDDLTHKDRETYLRTLYRPGTWAASLTAKAHPREFVTETVERPEAGLWIEGVPLVTPSSRGALGLDLTSVTSAGWLGRRFDEELALAPYDALRVDTDTRLNAGADVGDVRVAGWLGGAATSYQERTDGAPDLTRTALVAGVRADLEAHRSYGAHGGFLELDGLRHVLDLDLEAAGRFFDSHDPSEVPFFDEREQEEERSAVTLRLRNRLQTRQAGGTGLRDVLDLDTWFRWHPDEVAPQLQRSPWALGWSLRAEPRPGGRLRVASEGDGNGRDGLTAATLAFGTQPDPRVDLSLAYRYLQDVAAAPLLQVSWRWSEKYSLRMTESYNFRNGDNDLVLLFRRHSNDHVISFGLSLRGSSDVGLELDVRPTIGGEVGASPSAFENEVQLDPTRAFR